MHFRVVCVDVLDVSHACTHESLILGTENHNMLSPKSAVSLGERGPHPLGGLSFFIFFSDVRALFNFFFKYLAYYLRIDEVPPPRWPFPPNTV